MITQQNTQLKLCNKDSLQLLSHAQLFATSWASGCQASLSINNSQSLLKLMSTESVMPSSHLILCHPLLPPSLIPSIWVFSNESVWIRWPKYWSFSFSSSYVLLFTTPWTLCDPTDCSTPGFPIHHQLPELAQTHQVYEAIQPSYLLLSPSPPALDLSQDLKNVK